MSFPYLDLVAVQRRSFLRPSYFTDVENQSPGFTVQSIASNSSYVNARLAKRYSRKRGVLPFGQQPPLLLGSGLAPPTVELVGRPILGSYLMKLQITTPGELGTAVFQWSSDGGYTFTAGVTTALQVPLGSTGMTAVFQEIGTYYTSNSYAAATPVPEIVLKWVTTLVTADVFRRHGVNPNDPLMQGLTEEVKQVRAEIEEAANSQTGLFDLPTSEDEGSAVSAGGPRAYSEQSPYTWAYRQEEAATRGIEGALLNPNSLVGR